MLSRVLGAGFGPAPLEREGILSPSFSKVSPEQTAIKGPSPEGEVHGSAPASHSPLPLPLPRPSFKEDPVAYQKWWQQTIGREKFVAAIKRWQANNPEKRRAHWIVNNALAAGKLTKGPCSVGSNCKGRIEAHHEDYSKPLEVTWLCRRHHRQADNERRNSERAA